MMGKLRCFAMNLIRWSKKGINNFQATIEKFTDSPQALISMLRLKFRLKKSGIFL